MKGGERFTPVQPTSVFDLRVGDIGFSTIAGGVGGWVSFGQWWIRDACRFTHTFIVVEAGPNGVWVIEAMSRGARLTRLQPGVYSRITAGYAWVRPHLTAEQLALIPAAAAEYVGVPYGFLTYALLAARRQGMNTPWLDQAVRDTGFQVCSQLVAQILADSGFIVLADRDPQEISPGALFYATDPRVIYTPTKPNRATR